MASKVLLTGGSGLLGQELQKLIDCDAPTHKELDITKITPKWFKQKYDIVIHAAAYTDVVGAEDNKIACATVNIDGTRNLVRAFPDAHFVYISTEYASNPTNWYAKTKLGGEGEAKQAEHYLIIRTLFKPRPFPHKAAFFNQYTMGDYVDVIAPLVAEAAMQKRDGLIWIGTGRKTIFELARETVPDISGIPVQDIKGVVLPEDYKL